MKVRYTVILIRQLTEKDLKILYFVRNDSEAFFIIPTWTTKFSYKNW